MKRFDKAELGRIAGKYGYPRDTFEKVVRLMALLISVVRTTLNDFDCMIINPIYDSVGFINSPAPITGKILT